MSSPGPEHQATLADIAPQAVAGAARDAGLNAQDARLMRLYATAVYHLPAADAVARVALATSPETAKRLAVSVRATRWLTEIGFPCVEPLVVDQPVLSSGCAVTFWRYLPQEGPEPRVAELGHLLRSLHTVGPPPFALPDYRPLRSLRRAIESSRAVDEQVRSWLRDHCENLLDEYSKLAFALPAGLIHGDAYRGNLLHDGNRVVLADWDGVSAGPREIDLIPTLQAPRFGLPEHERDEFIAAYGYDIRHWDGYGLLRDIRELSTMTALLRNGHADPAARQELEIRIRSIRNGDNHRWKPF